MNINIIDMIVNRMDQKDIKNFSLTCIMYYNLTYNIRLKIKAVKKICKWWQYHKLPLDIHYSDLMSDFLINFPYLKLSIYIPHLHNPENVWLMNRIYGCKIYLQFNRYDDNLPYISSFIIGRIDFNDKFYKLNREEFLLCLKRYGQCLDPKTLLVWRKDIDKRRRIVAKLDQYYNIYSI